MPGPPDTMETPTQRYFRAGDRINIAARSISAAQYRWLFPDLTDNLPDGDKAALRHFDHAGKHELAVAALRTAIDDVVGQSSLLDGDAPPVERIERYLAQPRPGMRGCRIGRMTQDPQVVADTEMLALVAEAFDVMTERWTRVIAEAVAAGELPANTVPGELALTLSAVIQGGYVLARAHGSQEPMDTAIRGAVALIEAARAAARPA